MCMMRSAWLVVFVASLGCQTLDLTDIDLSHSRASRLWSQGQAAMRADRLEEAIAHYEQSLEADPSYTQNHLSLAAARLETGDSAAACLHLARYVESHPDHLVVRAHFAELLWRLSRLPEARVQFEIYEADVQELGANAMPQRIQCHSRLTRIAEAEEDEYAEHLHRGIGLFLLAQDRAALSHEECALTAESLLCRSAGELSLARLVRPQEARPCWYLYEVWSSLAQRQPALRSLREADDKAPFSSLSSAELRELQMACQREKKDRGF